MGGVGEGPGGDEPPLSVLLLVATTIITIIKMMPIMTDKPISFFFLDIFPFLSSANGPLVPPSHGLCPSPKDLFRCT